MATPWLIAMKGAPGSGKSTLARALGAAHGWPVIDKDDIKDVLAGALADPMAGGLAYDAMRAVVASQLRLGLTVICDSPLLARTYQGLRAAATATGAGLVVIDCACGDETVWRERVIARQQLALADHHITTWAGVLAFQERHAGNSYPISEPVLTVDTTVPLSTCLALIDQWLADNGVWSRA